MCQARCQVSASLGTPLNADGSYKNCPISESSSLRLRKSSNLSYTPQLLKSWHRIHSFIHSFSVSRSVGQSIHSCSRFVVSTSHVWVRSWDAPVNTADTVLPSRSSQPPWEDRQSLQLRETLFLRASSKAIWPQQASLIEGHLSQDLKDEKMDKRTQSAF